MQPDVQQKIWYTKDTVWDNTVEFNFLIGRSDFTVDLFNGNVLSLFNTNPNLVTSLPPLANEAIFTGSSTSYNQFIQDLRTNPKLVRRIIIAPVNNKNYYFSTPFMLYDRDANGLSITRPKVVNTYFSKYQFQDVLNVDFAPGELILDNNTIFNQYTFIANSAVKIILFYKEIKLADILGTEGIEVCTQSCEGMHQPVYTEEYMDMMEYMNMIPAKQAAKERAQLALPGSFEAVRNIGTIKSKEVITKIK